MHTNSLNEEGLIGKAAQEIHICCSQREANEGQNETEEQELGQRVLAAKACDSQLGDGVLIGQCALEIKSLDDAAHTDRLLVAQAFSPALGLCGQAGALLGAQFVTLQRDRSSSAPSTDRRQTPESL
jgi:hypothetical protein